MTRVHRSRLPLMAVCVAAALPASAADWKANETVKTYAISGTTGSELYASIGGKGPLLSGGVRVIAHTTFDLKWSRKYEPQADGSCRLVSAKPFLTITYTLPKPSQKLSSATAARWAAFIDGMTAHEKVHGQHIRELVDEILAVTVGFSFANDPGCKKIREAIKTPLAAASQRQRERSRDFDKVEMSSGGNVHRLVLALVNG